MDTGKYTSDPYLAREYIRFLNLKFKVGDFDAEMLSPSGIVDYVWHKHILDTKSYREYCLSHFGRFIDHNPDGAQEFTARRLRYERTLEEYKKAYAIDPPEAYWPPFDETEEDEDHNPTLVSSNVPSIHIKIRDLQGQEHSQVIAPDTTILQMKQVYGKDNGIPDEHMRLVFGGKQLADECTALESNIIEGSVVMVVLKLC
ncbi:hypothetical protein PROFUN_02725 [Planoprotostelium fungivorum]|uniref:Ubiquitin-like domain-containing protein n=1 Tax=Planoprotostelium fungivorum TaxID=1890364 RepID=A0A2P6NVU1_9EUKA|nr:hypothetical protein PROFUN_02725 [Planoprotostelium fungivorum]